MLTTLMLRAVHDCRVNFGGSFFEVGSELPLVMPVRREDELVFTVWGMEEDGELVPVPRLVTLSPSKESASVPTVDWGDVLEAEVEPFYIRRKNFSEPRLLDSCGFFLGDRRAKAELYSDGGLELCFTPDVGAPVTYSLGEGTEGSLRVLDVGSARLLSVRAKTDRGERLVLVNRNAETVLDAEGDSAEIIDGTPTVTERNKSVCGLERRTFYSFKAGRLSDKRTETGFFSNESNRPETAVELAMAAAEEARLGMDDKWRELVSKELSEELDGDALRSFLGEFTEARLHPTEERDGRVTLGLLNGKGNYLHPRRFVFVVRGGLLSDIEEL